MRSLLRLVSTYEETGWRKNLALLYTVRGGGGEESWTNHESNPYKSLRLL
jgi:hypothetical protein